MKRKMPKAIDEKYTEAKINYHRLYCTISKVNYKYF